jgi:2'-5' RNA ligase
VPESAVLIAVPEAEPIVGRWRDRLDPSASKGVPAHITLLYPFAASEEIDPGVVAALGELFGPVSAFAFRLGELGRFPSVLYLRPEPVEAFRGLIDAVTRRFPAFPPYGGEFDESVPHLTVAESDDVAVLAEVEADLLPRLPLQARAVEAQLMVEDRDGRWRVAESLPFGGG